MAGEWIQQVPQDLRTNEALTGYATLGDLAKSHVEAQGKLTEFDGKIKGYEGELKTLKENSIPKLPEDATEEERNVYYLSLGRPEKPDGYEFPENGGVKNSPEMVKWAQETFYKAGIPKESAKLLSQEWNGFLQTTIKKIADDKALEKNKAEEALKKELGPKYDATVEMVRRVWQKHSDSTFDAFCNETGIGNDARMIRFVAKMAKLTGEDTSPSGVPLKGAAKGKGMIYDKSPAPPKT